VQRRSDAILIGLFFGPTAVGIYRMADRLINMIIEMTTRPFVMVVLPHFSHLQDNIAELRKSVKQSLAASAMLTIPLLAILAGLAYLICATLSSKGENWLDATMVIQILALTGAARAVTLFAGPLVQSINRPRMFMTMNWSLAALNAVGFCVAGWWLSGQGDVKTQAVGVAMARAFVFCLIYTPICLVIMARICKTSVFDMLRSTSTAVVVAVVVFAVGFMIDHTLRHVHASNFWMKLGLLSIGGAITTGLAVFLMFRMDPQVREFILKRFRGKNGPKRGFDVAAVGPVEASQVPANP
jgi:O-antigen/teichoic acid export membrane protein